MIKIVARSTVRPECIEQYQVLARELAEKSQAEPGNLSYTLNQSISDPRVHCMLECWRDQEAIDFHNATEHFTRIVPLLRSMRESSDPVELFKEVTW